MTGNKLAILLDGDRLRGDREGPHNDAFVSRVFNGDPAKFIHAGPDHEFLISGNDDLGLTSAVHDPAHRRLLIAGGESLQVLRFPFPTQFRVARPREAGPLQPLRITPLAQQPFNGRVFSGVGGIAESFPQPGEQLGPTRGGQFFLAVLSQALNQGPPRRNIRFRIQSRDDLFSGDAVGSEAVNQITPASRVG